MASPKAVRLKNIEIKNFKSFNEASLSFPSDGLVALNAKNQDTGGSSGSGKSNLNNAIAYALGFAEAPATTLQSWNSEEPMQVVLSLDTTDGEVIVSKGHKNYLKIGKKTVTGAKAIEEELKRIFGVDATTLKTLVYRPQKSSGLFLSMDDAEKKEFLGRVLDLNKFDVAVDLTKDEVSNAKVRHQTAVNGFESVSRLVDQYPVKQEPFVNELVLDEMNDKIKELENKADQLRLEAQKTQDRLDILEHRHKNKLDEIKKEAAVKIKELQTQIEEFWNGYSFVPDMTEIDACQSKLDAIKPRLNKAKESYDAAVLEHRTNSQLLAKKIAQANMAVKQIPALKKKYTEVQHQIETLKGGTCYVCKRDGFYEQHTLDACEKEATSLNSQIDEFSEVAGTIDALQEQLSSMQEPSNEMHSKLSSLYAAEQGKLNALTAGLKTQEEQAKKNYGIGCERLQNDLKLLKSETQRIISETDSEFVKEVSSVLKMKKTQLDSDAEKAQAEAVSVEQQLKSIVKNNEESQRVYKNFLILQKQFEEAKVSVETSKRDLDMEQAALDMLRGFVGSIFEEILAEVADETNKILATIPNVAHCSIDFQTEFVTQKGTTKQKITPMVNVSGHVTPIKAGCSGGMETAIELAVDIAISNIIARRTGASPQWLILDEAFDGFDNIAKESCLEMLQKHANDKLVIVVSHISEFKEFFSSSIWVEYQNGESRIVNVPA